MERFVRDLSMKKSNEVIKFYNRNFHNVISKITGKRLYSDVLKVMKGLGIDKQFAKTFDLRDYEIKPFLVSMGGRDCDVIITKGAGWDGADDLAIYIYDEVLHIDYDFDDDDFF